MEVATISVEKADLRLGPGKNNSALMTLPRGSRLAVEARSGEWYRVFAPNGQRAWIHSSLVRFGDGSASLNDGSSVTVRGFDPSVGEGAFGRGR
jgi:SH3-like domain-containing protein